LAYRKRAAALDCTNLARHRRDEIHFGARSRRRPRIPGADLKARNEKFGADYPQRHEMASILATDPDSLVW